MLATGAFAVCPQVAEAGPARIATGPDAGSGPQVKAFTTRTLSNVGSFDSYASSFTGGVRVAVGDVNGDGGPDLITGSGPGAAHVKVFAGSGMQEIRSFLPYDANFAGGVFVAAGDVDGDGLADIVTGPDQGAAPHVKVFSGATGLAIQSFFAYSVSFSGGVRVAAGDVDGDGRAEIVTVPGPGTAPNVRVFDGITLAERASFFAYAPDFTGGAFIGASSLVRPQLQIDPQRPPGAIQLSWPTGFSCQPQASPQLSSPAGRANVSARPTQAGNRMQLAIDVSQAAEFFRLKYDEEAAP